MNSLPSTVSSCFPSASPESGLELRLGFGLGEFREMIYRPLPVSASFSVRATKLARAEAMVMGSFGGGMPASWATAMFSGLFCTSHRKDMWESEEGSRYQRERRGVVMWKVGSSGVAMLMGVCLFCLSGEGLVGWCWGDGLWRCLVVLVVLGVWGFDRDSCETAGGMAFIEGVYVSARGNRECGI